MQRWRSARYLSLELRDGRDGRTRKMDSLCCSVACGERPFLKRRIPRLVCLKYQIEKWTKFVCHTAHGGGNAADLNRGVVDSRQIASITVRIVSIRASERPDAQTNQQRI
jgi:hypothetical protein